MTTFGARISKSECFLRVLDDSESGRKYAYISCYYVFVLDPSDKRIRLGHGLEANERIYVFERMSVPLDPKT